MRFKNLDGPSAAVAAAAAAILGCRASPPSVEWSRAPDRNVLLVTIDTLRADALGCDGGPARTPNIDALAREGLRFTFAHAHTVVTLPSHASILTGLYPFQHGIRDNTGFALARGTTTLAARLHEAGIATGAFVGAFPLDARFGLTPGFDVYDGRFDDSGAGAEFILPERPAPAVVSRATQWIGARPTRWLAWVHLYEPHAPYKPPPPFDRDYAGQPYYGEVAAVDAALGPLFDAARASPRPTLVVVTGDHGEALGEHGEATHGVFAYEPTLRIPLIIAEIHSPHPSKSEQGGVSDAPVTHVDIVPTILDALTMPVPPELPGRSLRTAAARDAMRDRVSYFEAMSPSVEYGWAPLSGALAGREKFIDLPIRELYDLDRDPREAQNLAAASAARVGILEGRLAQFGAGRPSAPAAVPADAAARLRSLGYVAASAAPKTRYGDGDDPKRLVDLDRRMHDAAALDDRGDLRAASAVYEAIRSRRPDMMAASRHLAFDQWRLGDAAAAIATLRAALQRSGPSAGAETQLGAYLVETGRGAEAITLLSDAASREPGVDTLNALGLAYARGNRTRDAVAAFTRALDVDASSAVTYENIGAAYLAVNDVDLAARAFERAVSLDPQSSSGHNGLALVAMKRGDRAAAIDHWKRAVAAQPSNFDALYDLGVQLARGGQSADARTYLVQFTRTAPPAQYAKEIQEVNAILAQLR